MHNLKSMVNVLYFCIFGEHFPQNFKALDPIVKNIMTYLRLVVCTHTHTHTYLTKKYATYLFYWGHKIHDGSTIM